MDVQRFGAHLGRRDPPTSSSPTERTPSWTIGIGAPGRRAMLLLALLALAAPLSDGARVAHQPLLRLRGGFDFVGGYNRALQAAPLATNCASAAVLGVISDGIAQRLTMPEGDAATSSSTRTPWDWERSAWMLVWGASVSGAIIFYWLRFLGALFPGARSSVAQLVGKIFVNQCVMAPGLNGGFFAFVIWTRTAPRLLMTALKRQRLMDKYRADLLKTCVRSTYFWSCAQAVNFRLVPTRYGVLWVNACFVVWTTYLSLVGNRAAKTKREQTPD